MMFTGCEALYPIFTAVLRDWPMVMTDFLPGSEVVITLERIAERYERRSSWQPEPIGFRDPVDAVCDFIVDLIHAYVGEHQKNLCLHGAAVELGAGLMVFPNTYRAGKSILSIKLVSLGARLFSDDVLPIDHQRNTGTALGILPRLRLPLPDKAEQSLISFIDHRIGPQNKRYRYIRLDEDELAPLGSVAPVAAITILERDPGAKPLLRPAKQSDVVKHMILRNFARQNPAIEIVDRIHGLVEQAECYTLTYDTLEQAADLLDDAFGIIPERKAS
jgi:hypothetical protein